jgi:hypothetical protein
VAIEGELQRLETSRISASAPGDDWRQRVLGGAPLSRDLTAMELLRRPGVHHADLLELIER